MDSQACPPPQPGYLPPPPPPPAPVPAAPLTSAQWSARAALVFGVAAFGVNALFSWALARGPLSGFFRGVSRTFASLPKPLALAAYLTVFAVVYLALYVLLLLVPVLSAVRHRRTPDEAFGLRRFSVPLAIGLVVAFYVVGIMANGVWTLGLRTAHVRIPAQDITRIVRGLAGTGGPSTGTRSSASAAAPGSRSKLETLPRFALLFLLIAVVAPIAEEVVYRGVVYASLRAAWGEAPGVIVSSLLFGLVHLDWRFAVPAVVLGVLLANIFRMTRSLWPAIMLHATYNGLSLIIVYVLALSGRSVV